MSTPGSKRLEMRKMHHARRRVHHRTAEESRKAAGPKPSSMSQGGASLHEGEPQLDWGSVMSPAQIPVRTMDDAFAQAPTWSTIGMDSFDPYSTSWDATSNLDQTNSLFSHDSGFSIAISSPCSLQTPAGTASAKPMNQENYEFGTISIGGGSGAARLFNHVSLLQALRERAVADGSALQFWLNNTYIVNTDVPQLFSPAEPEVCLVFTKSWAREGWDRETLSLDWQGDKVIERVAGICRNTVVVMHTAGVVMMPWADHPNVTAIVSAHYPGEENGHGLTDVRYGDVNPSGKLPCTVAHKAEDYDFAPITTKVTTSGREDWQSWFNEKLYIDYRYFDAHNMSVLYEFGHGLSYTTFALSDMSIDKVAEKIVTPLPREQDVVPGGRPDLWEVLFEVNATARNTGHARGATVVQLYITLPDSAPEGTPVRQLRGFEKVDLASCGKQTVSLALMRRDISYWDVVAQQWRVPEGEFTVSLGFSSRDIVQVGTFTAIVE